MIDFQKLLYSKTIDANELKSFVDILSKNYSRFSIDHELWWSILIRPDNITIIKPFITKQNIPLPNHFLDNETICLLNMNGIEVKSTSEEEYDKELIKIINEDKDKELKEYFSDKDLNFSYEIKKKGGIFKYTTIPIILYCIQKKALKCYKYLLMEGADPNKRCLIKSEDGYIEYGWNGAQFAVAVEANSIKSLITENINQEELIFPLIRFQRNEEIFRQYVEKIEITKELIQEAAEFNNIRILTFFFQSTHSIDLIHSILSACENGHIEIVKELINRGANINAKGYSKRRRDKD